MLSGGAYGRWVSIKGSIHSSRPSTNVMFFASVRLKRKTFSTKEHFGSEIASSTHFFSAIVRPPRIPSSQVNTNFDCTSTIRSRSASALNPANTTECGALEKERYVRYSIDTITNLIPSQRLNPSTDQLNSAHTHAGIWLTREDIKATELNIRRMQQFSAYHGEKPLLYRASLPYTSYSSPPTTPQNIQQNLHIFQILHRRAETTHNLPPNKTTFFSTSTLAQPFTQQPTQYAHRRA